MKWTEIIRVQAGRKAETAEYMLSRFADELTYTDGVTEVEIQVNAELSTDYSLLIRWDTDRIKAPGSREGLHIKEALKGVGAVNHSIWITGSRSGMEKAGILIG